MELSFVDFAGGARQPFFLIAGPCVIEGESLTYEIAHELKELTSALGISFIFKTSFEKANPTSVASYRGPGSTEGLRVLARIRDELGVPVLTAVHEDAPIGEVAAVVDVLQTPASLVRQTVAFGFTSRRPRAEAPRSRTCRLTPFSAASAPWSRRRDST